MADEKQTILSQKTLIPIGTILVLLGGAIWLGTLSSDIQRAKKDIADLQQNDMAMNTKVDELKQYNSSANERMARIETKIDILIDQFKKK